MFELFRHLYWEAGKPTVAAESHFQWERGDAGELEGQVGRIATVKNCWYNPQVWAKQWVSCPWVWHVYARFWTSTNLTSAVCSWSERGSISTHCSLDHLRIRGKSTWVDGIHRPINWGGKRAGKSRGTRNHNWVNILAAGQENLLGYYNCKVDIFAKNIWNITTMFELIVYLI